MVGVTLFSCSEGVTVSGEVWSDDAHVTYTTRGLRSNFKPNSIGTDVKSMQTTFLKVLSPFTRRSLMINCYVQYILYIHWAHVSLEGTNHLALSITTDVLLAMTTAALNRPFMNIYVTLAHWQNHTKSVWANINKYILCSTYKFIIINWYPHYFHIRLTTVG